MSVKRLFHALLEGYSLRFASSIEEAEFFKAYCLDRLPITRAAAFLAGLTLYVFYIWDKTVDPINWEKTQMLRGLVIVPICWGSTGLLLLPKLHKYAEPIFVMVFISVSVVLLYICLILRHAFDYCEPGLIIIFFFLATLIQMRLVFYVISFAIGGGLAVAFQLYSGDYRPGMLLINNLYTGTTAFLALFAVTTRELDARRQFRGHRELVEARTQVEGLLAAFLRPEEVERMRRRKSQGGQDETRLAISYRRADTEAIAGRIRDRLVGSYGEGSVFMDIDSIPYGLDFRAHIEKVFRSIDVLVVLVGPRWLEHKDGRSRLDEPTDPVRVELETAMISEVVVLPILVGGATMPAPSALPDSLRNFAFRNAAEVESGRDFSHHIERLVRSIDSVIDAGRASRNQPAFAALVPGLS